MPNLTEINYLNSINDSLKSIDGTLKALLALSRARTAKKAPEIASDADLDGKYGNPEVRFDPRDWPAESCKGLRMSECPADFLDMLAETFDYFAAKAEETNEQYNGKPVAPYKRKDAARARGWAKRIREGRVMPRVANEPGWGGANDEEW